MLALLDEGEPILPISAKTGEGVEAVLEAIIKHIPPPSGSPLGVPFRALAFDSWFDEFKGVVSLISVASGKIGRGEKHTWTCSLRKSDFGLVGDRITSINTQKNYEVNDIGILHPGQVPVSEGLATGQVGYITCGMKDPMDGMCDTEGCLSKNPKLSHDLPAFLGDTFHKTGTPTEPLEAFRPQKAMVYAGLFPFEASQFPKLEESVRKLTLTDRSVSVQRESSAALGQGFRLGFLGALHAEVFKQRLEDEYQSEVLITKSFVSLKRELSMQAAPSC